MEGLGLTVISSFSDKKVLITGANGFIGSHLARRLLREGASVHIFIRENGNRLRVKDLEGRVQIWEGDIRTFSSVKTCIQNSRPQVIFHLAGMRDVTRDIGLTETMIDTNLKGTLNVVSAVIENGLQLECFINTGSSEEYGDGTTPFSEEQRERPVSPYSASKVAATYFCQMLHKSLGLPIVILRPFLAYGPDQGTDMFIPSLITHCLKKEDFHMTSGEQTRDFVFIDDVVEAFLLAASMPEAIGEIFNIGTGKEHRIKDVAEMILDMTGRPIKLLVGSLKKRPGESNHFFCDNRKAEALLGWSPKTGLKEGLSKTIEWYKTNYTQEYTVSVT